MNSAVARCTTVAEVYELWLQFPHTYMTELDSFTQKLDELQGNYSGS